MTSPIKKIDIDVEALLALKQVNKKNMVKIRWTVIEENVETGIASSSFRVEFYQNNGNSNVAFISYGIETGERIAAKKLISKQLTYRHSKRRCTLHL